MEAHTAVVENQQKLCSARRCRAHPLAQEGISIQPPLCVQKHLVRAKDLLLRGKMIHEVQAHLSLSRFLQDPHARLPVLYSGRKGSCLVVEHLGKYTLDSTGAYFDFKDCDFLTFFRELIFICSTVLIHYLECV
jgi:hypothetical protein